MKPILWLWCTLTSLYVTSGQDVAKDVLRIWKVNSTENSLSLKYDPPDVPVNASICYCDPQTYTCNKCKETSKEDDSWCKRFNATFVNGKVTLIDLRPSSSYVVVLYPPEDHEDFERTVEGCYQTEATTPEPVEITTVEPSYSSVNISWSVSSTSVTPDSYIVRIVETSFSTETTSRSYVVKNLQPETNYTINIVAKKIRSDPNGQDFFSEPSSVSVKTKPLPIPEPVEITTVQPNYWGVNISWSVSPTSVIPDSYIVRVAETNFFTETTNRSYVIKDLQPETEYTIEIIAKKTWSDSNWQDTLSEPRSVLVKTEPLPVPEPVEIAAVKPSYRSVNVSWSVSSTSVTPDSYIVRVVEIDFSTETTDRSYVVKELKPETEYTIEIIAKKIGSDPNRREFFSEPRSVSVKTEPLRGTDSTTIIAIAVSVSVIVLIAGAAIFRWKIIRSRNARAGDQSVAYSQSSETVTTAQKM